MRIHPSLAAQENPMTRRPAPRIALALALPALLAAGVARAGSPADEARQHFQAIGSGDAEAMSRGYADDAQLVWVGGPLDGRYVGPDAIRGVWEKFSKAQGKLDLAVDRVEESLNPKGGTVTANVEFTGKAAIKVRYVLTYRDGRIVAETWQIDPKLAVAGR
jgi:ketosteroid isomerase-like protein